MIGSVFGRLEVIDGPIHKERTYWLCKCECGTVKTIRQDHLKSEKVVSCGCYKREQTSHASKTHGMKETPLYRVWRNMKSRCYNPNYTEFHRYGGRGISVCDEWQQFIPFYEWAIVTGYDEGLSLDRIDNDGNYAPENCRWATPREQAMNRSTNKFVTYNGVTKHISEWDKDIGAKKSGRVRARLNAGWDVKRAVSTPLKNNE